MEIRPILSALMRSKVALILIGVGLISAQPVSAAAHRATQRALER